MQRFKRIARMIDLINRGRCPTRDDLCREFECGVRTVDEDVRFLKEDLHLPIEFDRFKNGYVNTDPKQKLPEFDLDMGEVLALTIGLDMLSEYSGTSLEPVLEAAFDKIADRLPEKIRLNLNEFVTAVRFKPTGVAPITRKIFFDFAEAIDAHHPISIVYYGARKGDTTERVIEPLRVLENRAAWYCIAWCRERNAIRMFALHRVRSYKVLQETFKEREDLGIDRYVDEAFLLEHGEPPKKYVVWFDETAARYVRERQWHASQEINEHDDGSLTVTFSATSMDEVRRWVLGYGASAQVLEPVELQTILRAELAKALARYDKAPVQLQLQLPFAAQTKVDSQSPKISKYESTDG